MTTPEVTATVKWGTKVFVVELNSKEPFEVFQAQLYTLTGVPVERQKLLYKGKTIKDDADLRSLPTAGGLKFMFMGTAEDKVEAKEASKKTVFLEDLTPSQQAALLREKQIEPLPNGIVNLGNTCYLASVLQLLRPVTDFSFLLKSHIHGDASTAQYAASGQQGAIRRVALALKDFYNLWDRSLDAVSPFFLVRKIMLIINYAALNAQELHQTLTNVPTLREAYPQFARRPTSQAGTTGLPMQQDAEECLSCLLSAVGESLDAGAAEALSKTLPYVPKESGSSALDMLFGVRLEVTTKRNKSGTVTADQQKGAVQVERHRKLTCFLGTPQKPVNTLDESLNFSLGDEVVRVGSASSVGDGGEDTVVRSNRIGSLALYLIVHFMRFEWKTGGNEPEKAKICRSVKFGQTLDMFTYCTKELQDSFKVGRAVVALRREREAFASGTSNTNSSSAKPSESAPSSQEKYGATVTAGAAATKSSSENSAGETSKGDSDIMGFAGKPCPTGTYQLLSVVTHQGRYADSGHYVGWARAGTSSNPQGPSSAEAEGKKEDEDESKEPRGPASKRKKNVMTWRKFDDDRVSEIPWESIDLSGGRSDYHVAYLLLFKQILVTPTEEELRAVAALHW